MEGFKDIDFKENEYIYTDTSAMLQFLGYNERSKTTNEISSLFAKARNANTPLVLSHIVLEEILNVVIRDTFNRNGYKSQSEIKNLKEKNLDTYQKILGQALNDYHSYKRKITTNEMFLKEILAPSAETYKKRDELMFEQNIFGSADATHLALALEYGIEYFATCDSDFKNISLPELTILYTNGNDT